MIKKKHQLRNKISRALVSVFVLAVVLTPSLLTATWAVGIVSSHDHRKVIAIPAFHARAVDSTAKPLQPFSEPMVSVTFDDGWETVYTNALPLLQQDGIHTTQYIITDTFKNPSYMSVAQLQSMEKAGHQIASHTVTHPDLTTLTDQELDYELGTSKAILTSDFGPIKDFTSPYGAYNAHTLQMISKYYRSQKNAEGDPSAYPLESINVKKTFDPMNITSYTVRQSTTLDDIKKLLSNAHKNNGWLVLTYHQIDNSGDEYAVKPEVFAKQIQLVEQSNLRSATVGQVLDAIAQEGKDK